MEKQLRREYSTVQFQKSHPSCIRGLFQFFDFHQRLHIKKMLSDMRHGNRRHAGDVKNSKTKANVSATGEAHNSTGEEVNGLIEYNMNGGSPSKQLGQACIKTLIGREMSKERVKKRRSSSFSARLLRTESIHYADYDPDEKPSVDDSPSIRLFPQKTSSSTGTIHESLLPKQLNDLTSKKHCEVCGAVNGGSYSNNSRLDVPESHLLERQALLEKLLEAKEALLKQSQSQEFLEALQIFNTNRELLLKILQDPNSLFVNHAQASPSRESVLTKCGSFPGAELPGRMSSDRMKLKHKQRESKSVSMQEEQLQTQYFQPNSYSVDMSGNSHSEITSLVDGGTGLEALPGPSHVLKSGKDNGVVMNRFKGIKQKLKYVIKENKKEQLRISMDGILHKIPYGHMPSMDTKSLFDSPRKSYESDGAVAFSEKNQLRRAPSLNESLDRYSHLFGTILSKEGKQDLSEGVKLGHDDGDLFPGKHSKKTFTRILSSPEIWSYYASKEVDSDAFHDTLNMGTLSRISVDSGGIEIKNHDAEEQKQANIPLNAEAERQIESFTENGTQEVFVEEGTGRAVEGDENQGTSGAVEGDENQGTSGAVEGDENQCTSGAVEGDENQSVLDSDANENDEVDGVEDDESGMVQKSSYIPSQEQKTTPMKDSSTTLVQPSPISVLGPCFADDVVSPTRISCPKGSELKPTSMRFDNVDLETKADVLDRGLEEENDEVQSPSDHAHFDIACLQVDSKDEADFNYVRDILKKSRFSVDELLGVWYSPDQPVDPSLFDEIECSTPGQGSNPDDIGISFDHMLLFDLINEVLLEIHERSFMHSPWLLCANSRIRPMPVGPHVLEEVWSRISSHLNYKPKYLTLDNIVGRDFTKNDGWINIQPEAECVTLELEDWILDDLLDEVTFEIAGF